MSTWFPQREVPIILSHANSKHETQGKKESKIYSLAGFPSQKQKQRNVGHKHKHKINSDKISVTILFTLLNLFLIFTTIFVLYCINETKRELKKNDLNLDLDLDLNFRRIDLNDIQVNENINEIKIQDEIYDIKKILENKNYVLQKRNFNNYYHMYLVENDNKEMYYEFEVIE